MTLRCVVGHTSRELIGVLTLTSMMVTSDVAVAQDRALSLNELLHAGSLQPGEGVYVTDAAGRRLKGTLSDVSSAGLVVRHGGQTWVVAVADVRRIDLQNPLSNGIGRRLGVHRIDPGPRGSPRVGECACWPSLWPAVRGECTPRESRAVGHISSPGRPRPTIAD